MINAFDGIISRLDKVEERVSELRDMSIINPKTKMQRKRMNNNNFKKQRISKNSRTFKKSYISLYIYLYLYLYLYISNWEYQNEKKDNIAEENLE